MFSTFRNWFERFKADRDQAAAVLYGAQTQAVAHDRGDGHDPGHLHPHEHFDGVHHAHDHSHGDHEHAHSHGDDEHTHGS